MKIIRNKASVLVESNDPNIQSVISVMDQGHSYLGLRDPLARVFGKKNVDSTFMGGGMAWMIKTRQAKTLVIAPLKMTKPDPTDHVYTTSDGSEYVIGYM